MSSSTYHGTMIHHKVADVAQLLQGVWTSIWASHSYGILKLCNVNLDCDVAFW